jgi:YidC/Oxa1 family membrane protein insertase
VNFCILIFLFYFLTPNFSFISNFAVLKVPGVKKTLGIPDLPPPEPSSSPKAPFSILQAIKQAASVAKGESSMPVESSKQPNKKLPSSSSAVISQRLRSLEKKVKGRKKSKKL